MGGTWFAAFPLTSGLLVPCALLFRVVFIQAFATSFLSNGSQLKVTSSYAEEPLSMHVVSGHVGETHYVYDCWCM